METVESRDGYVVQDSCATGERDGCVVDSEPLARIVTGFVTEWRRERPPVSGQFGAGQSRKADDVEPMSPLDWLAQETGLPRDTIENLTTRGRDGKPGRTRTTELRIADSILTALGRTDLFNTLEVKPNPQAKPKYRNACCGGSLTGVVEP